MCAKLMEIDKCLYIKLIVSVLKVENVKKLHKICAIVQSVCNAANSASSVDTASENVSRAFMPTGVMA